MLLLPERLATTSDRSSKTGPRPCETNGAKQEGCEENFIIVTITPKNQKTGKHFDYITHRKAVAKHL